MFEKAINVVGTYGNALNKCAGYLPLIWVTFVFTEWWLLRKHYLYFRIEHSFRPNYKIAFNPRYLISLMVTIGLWFVYQDVGWYLDICMLAFLMQGIR